MIGKHCVRRIDTTNCEANGPLKAQYKDDATLGIGTGLSINPLSGRYHSGPPERRSTDDEPIFWEVVFTQEAASHLASFGVPFSWQVRTHA